MKRKNSKHSIDLAGQKLIDVRQHLQDERDYSESIIETIRKPLLVLDKDLRVVSAGRAFYDTFKVKEKETEGKLIYKLGNGQWNIPALKVLLSNVLSKKSVFQDYEIDHEFKTIGKKHMILNGREIKRGNGKSRLILLAIEDVTEKRKAMETIKASNQELTAANQELSALEQELRSSNQQLRAHEQQQTALEQQLKSSNQQLTAHEQQLKSSNQQLIAAEQHLKDERDYSESIIGTIRKPLLVLDKDLRVVSAGRAFYDTFKVKEKETEGKLIYKLGNGQWNIPALKVLLSNVLSKKSVFQDYEIDHEFKTIGKKHMILNGREIKRGNGKSRLILLAIEDVTEKRKAMETIKASNQELTAANQELSALEQELRSSNQQLRAHEQQQTALEQQLKSSNQQLIAAEQHLKDERDYSESIIGTIRKPLLVLDKDLRVVSAGRAFYDTFKVKEKETEGKLIYKLGNGQWNIPALKVLLSNVLSKKSVFQDYEIDHEFRTIGKKHMILNGRELKRGDGKNRLILLAIEDVTEKRKAIETIKASNQELTAANQELSALEQELRSSNQQLIAHEQQQKDERDYAESIIGTIREPLLILDKNLRVVSASRSFYNTFKVKEKETEKKLVYELGNGQWNIPALKTLLTNILPKKSVFQSYEIEHEFTTIGKKNMILNARELKRGGSENRLILLAIEDVTEKRKAEDIIKASNQQLLGANQRLTAIEQQLKDERDYAESIIGTIRGLLLVLDKDLRVVSASRSFYEKFKVKKKEAEGKLVYKLGNGQWNIPALKTLLTNILPKKSIFQDYAIEHEFKTIGKKNMILNARELKRENGKNRLILLAIEDITETRKAMEIIKAAEQQIKYERDYAESIIGTIREPLLILDKDLRVVSASRSFYDTFKEKEKETEGKLVYKLGNGQWNIPALKTLLTNILPNKNIFQGYEIEHEFKTIGKKNMILNARELKRADGESRLILLAIEDVTEKRKAGEKIKAAEEELKEERDYAESIIGTVRESLLVLDKDLRVVSASRSFYDKFKVKEKETEGKLVYELGNGQWDIPALKILLTNILPNKNIFQGYEIEHEFKTIGKKNMILNARELKRADGESRLILLAIEDVTEKRKAEEIIKAANQKLTNTNQELTAIELELRASNRQLTEIEEQLKDERDYAESIIGTIREPLLVLDKDLRVVSASRSFYDTFKVKAKETEGNLVYKLGNEQWNIPALRILLTNILPEKSVFQDYEVEHEFKTIGKKNMILNAKELKSENHKNRLILLAIEDVTEKRKAEEKVKAAEVIKAANEQLIAANKQLMSTEQQLRTFNEQLKAGAQKLQESELKYRTLFETSVDGILIAEIETRKLVYANPSICKMLGYTKEELENMSITDIYPKDNNDNLKNNISKFGSQKEGVALEADIPCLKKNTEIVYVDINVTVASIDGKECNVGFFRDVVIRKKAQDDLIKSDNKYQYLIENLNEGVWVIDRDNLTTFTNERMAKMLGYEAIEMIGKSFFSFMDAVGIKIAKENMERQKNGIKEQHDFEFQKKDGKKMFAVLETAPILDDGGKYNGSIAGVIDITDRKKLEEQLLQSQKMESVGILAGGIAHDFNNLLTAIKGYSELAKESTAKDNPIYDDLNEICLAADRAADLTRQVLLFSRKQPLNPINLNLNRIIDNMSKMLNRIIGEDISIKTDLQLNLWNTNSDETKMEQIIMNLTINGRDAMNKGGVLTIKTENVIVSKEYSMNIAESYPGKFVKLSIQDNGMGINKEVLQHIFEPYFTTKGLGKGTGLGLSVVYGIVKQHNGWINVYSEPDRGTMFTIYLPSSSSEKKGEIIKEKYNPDDLVGHGERILVVEDEVAIRKYSSRVLLNNGYTVFLAGDVNEALTIFEKEKNNIKMVLSDVVLPDGTGIDLVNRLLLEKPEFKVILCSGYLDDRSQQQLIHGKGHKFLHKPFQLNELLVAVKETLAEGSK